jgi:hypothetical protein
MRKREHPMIVRRAVIAAAAAAVLLSPSKAIQAERAGVTTPSAVHSTTDKYCVSCHSTKLKTGGLVLENVDLEQASPDAAALREKMIRKLRAGAMPPARAARPDEATLTTLAEHLERINDGAAKAAPNPGRPIVHRLNRAEYANAVRDLLGIEIPAASILPADDSSYGFDNVADVLSVSPGLLDRYLHAARTISRLAVGDPTIRADVTSYKVNSSRLQDDRMSEELPFGTRGGLSVQHHFPTDGEYELRVTLQRNNTNMEGMIRGMDTDALIDVLMDGQRVREARVVAADIPREVGIERYKERAYGEGIEKALSVRLPVKAGAHQIAVTMARSFSYGEGVLTDRYPLASDTYTNGLASDDRNGKIDLEIAVLDVVGPYNGVKPESAHTSKMFSCAPAVGGETACATSILSKIARLAYRRPVTPDDMSVLMSFYRSGVEKGGFEQGMRAALERILVSPQFLFRREDDPANTKPGSVVQVSDLDLASRLSFFLWSSIPDDELLRAAETGRLRTPEVLRQQVARMIRDPRSKAMRANFFGQWLYVRNLAAQAPDPRLFPKFDEGLRQSFLQETDLFLESQLQEDRPVLELYTADYTFVNEKLARYYGIPNIYGNHFRRITLPSDGPRAGLLGQGSILTVTSYAHRTSPVVRGKWLLENIIGNPPPAPPANVPPFPENTGSEPPKSVRARLEQHRRNPICASCHSQIDPLGFALENFDATGQYRVKDDGNPVDSSGTLPDGSKFEGPAQFRQVLLARREQLMRTMTEKLLTYALGRGVEPYDQPAIRQIIREADASGDRWSSVITALVKSVPFQMRRSAS